MSDTDESIQLLREIRDVLVEQTKDNKENLLKNEQMWREHTAKQDESWNEYAAKADEHWRQLRQANKRFFYMLGLWLFIVVVFAVWWATAGH